LNPIRAFSGDFDLWISPQKHHPISRSLSQDGLMRRRGKILLARKRATLPIADAAALIQHLIELGASHRDE
jgi:hypothetical protein